MTAKSVQARLQEITKSDAAVLLMQSIQLHCSFKNGGVWFEGRHWSHRPTAEWAEKINASHSKTERLLRLLRNVNLVTTRMDWVGKASARRWVLHIALTTRAEAIFAGAEQDPQLCGGVTLKDEGGGPSNLKVPYNNPIDLPKNLPKNLPSDQLPAVALPEVDSNISGEEGEGKSSKQDAPQPAPQETDMNDMADNFKNEGWKAKSMKVLHKPNSPSSLETIWKHKISETDPLLIKIGKKERGQFTHFRNACPPDAADKVLTWVLDNWAHYAYKVAGYKALQKVPTAPDLGFLLLYDNIAVSCWNLSKAPKKQEAKPAISVDNPVQSPSLASKHKTVSMDDLLADPED